MRTLVLFAAALIFLCIFFFFLGIDGVSKFPSRPLTSAIIPSSGCVPTRESCNLRTPKQVDLAGVQAELSKGTTKLPIPYNRGFVKAEVDVTAFANL